MGTTVIATPRENFLAVISSLTDFLIEQELRKSQRTMTNVLPKSTSDLDEDRGIVSRSLYLLSR